MQRFKNILFVAEMNSHMEAALRRTARLAAHNRARLTLVGVIEPLPSRRRMVETDGIVHDLQEILLQVEQTRLERLAETARVEGLEPSVRVFAGPQHIEVIRQVLRGSHDLVVVPDTSAGFSSTTHHLLRKNPVPVWVLKPSRARKMRILAAVDPDPDDAVRDALNVQIMELATSVAERENAELRVVHLWSLPGEGMLRSSPYINVPVPEVEAMARAMEADHRRNLEMLLELYPLSELDATIHMVKGEPADVIPTLVEQHRINLIVMGTVARTGLAGLLIGNTAETILKRVECSVLAVKPPGFETPVRLDDPEQAADA